MGRPTFYDFFAGVGLAEIGLQPDWECVWANDLDEKKKAIYVANLGLSERFHLGDVADVRASDLIAPVDMAWASFPCQDLSLAGWRRGITARRSGTFWAFHRIMSELHKEGKRPPIIVIENVVGLLYGDSFAGLCEALLALDMQFGALVIDAKYFVPQSRPRVFIVAVDRQVDVRGLQDEFGFAGPWFPKSLANAWATLSDEAKLAWRWWLLPRPTTPVPSVVSLIEDEPGNVAWHTPQETQRLLDLMSDTNLLKVQQAQQSNERKVGFLYKRTRTDGQRAEVRFDGIAGCLRTTYGGSSRQTVVIVEGGQVRSRLLSPREAARLMGADDIRLVGTYNDMYRAMGDGVAVPVVSWLSRHLLLPILRPTEERGDSAADAMVTKKQLELVTA